MERKIISQFWKKFITEAWVVNSQATKISFEAGFAAGLDYQQRKLDAYAAYVAGKITQKELEEVVNA